MLKSYSNYISEYSILFMYHQVFQINKNTNAVYIGNQIKIFLLNTVILFF